MEYDFSKMSSDDIKAFIVNGSSERACTLPFYYCDGDCPFWDNCYQSNREERYIAFKEELKRRESMNEMPELKAGMIIKSQYTNYLYINDSWGISLDHNEWTSEPLLDIKEIYEITNYCDKSYLGIKRNMKLIWSKKSDTQIKIDELKQTVKEAQAMMDNAVKQIEQLEKQ